MIVVKVEKWPHGDERRAQPIGRVEICHLPGTLKAYEGHTEADYIANVFDANDRCTANRAVVRDHHRERGPWPLVRSALAMMFPR